MQIFHVFYAPKTGFNNAGNLYFWVEQSHGKIKKGYPYQLKREDLIGVAESIFDKELISVESLEIYVPYNNSGKIIPSEAIANIINIPDRNIKSIETINITAVKLNNHISALKKLGFHSHYLEPNQRLSQDAIFWIEITQKLTRAIKQDQYLPSIIPTQEKNKVAHYTKWDLVSSELTEAINNHLDRMPTSACLTAKHFDKKSLINNYLDSTINQFIRLTAKPNRLYKLVENTFVYDALDTNKSSLDTSCWKNYRLWHDALTYEQFGAPFQLCFKLHSAKDQKGDDWGLEILMQSKNEPGFTVNASEYWKTQKEKNTLYTKMLGTSTQKLLLLQLGYASRIVPIIELFFKYKMSQSVIPITTEQAFKFLKEDAWSLQASGYRIIIPSWWTTKGRLRAKIKLRARQKSTSEGDAPKSYFDQSSLVSFDYTRAIGGHEVSKEEWDALINSNSDLVFFRGEWLEIDPSEMKKIQTLIEQDQDDIGNIKDLLVKAAEDELYEVELDENIQKTMDQLRSRSEINILPSPSKLNATLRPYQLRGLSWLAFLEKIGISPCLADDMGLGKTMQIISLLLSSPGKKTALLIAPTSVIGNWQREIEKFAPSIKTYIYHGSNRDHKELLNEVANLNLVITSFSLARKDQKIFQQHIWSRLIVDEAQNIKNPAAAQTKAICKIQASSRIALTGTPIENRLTDLWSIFHFLNPGYLGNKAYFKRAFEMPVQRDNDPYRTRMLKNLVEPFILRRVKTDKNIIKDLPEKVEQKVYCQLTKEQASIYQNIVNDVKEKMDATENEQDKRALMLSTLLRLKQTCNHPAQILQDGSEFAINRSMKLKRTVDIITEVMANNESILIFSQFTEICDQLNQLLKTKYGLNTYYLHGGTSRTKREKMITDFQDKNTPSSVFILSLKSGGVGITLTKANHVIHFDRWWNPAIENQATDRAYRIGQQKTVFAHKFVTTGTLEERIDKMLEDKQKVSDMIIGSDESWLSKLDSKSFIDLIKLSQKEITNDTEELDAAEQEANYYDA